ncbi:hypothetical protein HAX54_044231 [Datura stramonium]|uniref:Uncharacterized protein n=1 Tax=Datura stramonium TaxID=4076 RepID=A0ABS8SNX5_DATST|nr:hypothetical protein [Datura stramonium]
MPDFRGSRQYCSSNESSYGQKRPFKNSQPSFAIAPPPPSSAANDGATIEKWNMGLCVLQRFRYCDECYSPATINNAGFNCYYLPWLPVEEELTRNSGGGNEVGSPPQQAVSGGDSGHPPSNDGAGIFCGMSMFSCHLPSDAFGHSLLDSHHHLHHPTDSLKKKFLCVIMF